MSNSFPSSVFPLYFGDQTSFKEFGELKEDNLENKDVQGPAQISKSKTKLDNLSETQLNLNEKTVFWKAILQTSYSKIKSISVSICQNQ
jgi:hypothetical protein